MTDCKHNKTELHFHYRKNYSHGKMSQQKPYAPAKLVNEHCIACKKIISKWRPGR